MAFDNISILVETIKSDTTANMAGVVVTWHDLITECDTTYRFFLEGEVRNIDLQIDVPAVQALHAPIFYFFFYRRKGWWWNVSHIKAKIYFYNIVSSSIPCILASLSWLQNLEKERIADIEYNKTSERKWALSNWPCQAKSNYLIFILAGGVIISFLAAKLHKKCRYCSQSVFIKRIMPYGD